MAAESVASAPPYVDKGLKDLVSWAISEPYGSYSQNQEFDAMAEILVATPTTVLSTSATAQALTLTDGTAFGANTGINFQNNGAIVVHLSIGSAGAGTLTLPFYITVEGQTPASLTYSLSNSTSYLLGPFSPSHHNDSTGLCHLDISVQAGNYYALYLLPGAVA